MQEDPAFVFASLNCRVATIPDGGAVCHDGEGFPTNAAHRRYRSFACNAPLSLPRHHGLRQLMLRTHRLKICESLQRIQVNELRYALAQERTEDLGLGGARSRTKCDGLSLGRTCRPLSTSRDRPRSDGNQT